MNMMCLEKYSSTNLEAQLGQLVGERVAVVDGLVGSVGLAVLDRLRPDSRSDHSSDLQHLCVV